MTILAVPKWVESRRWSVLAVLTAFTIPFLTRLPYTLDLYNPDMGGYLMASFLALMFLVAEAVSAMASMERPAYHRLTSVLAISMTVALVGWRAPLEFAQDTSADQYARDVLAEVPLNGTLVLSDYSTVFGVWWLRTFEGARPDVAVIFRGQRHLPWFAERLETMHPIAASKLANFPDAFAQSSTRWEPGIRFDRLGRIGQRLRPVGLTYALDAPWPSVTTMEYAFGVFDSAQFSGLRFQALLQALMAEHAIRLGAPASILQWHLRRLVKIAPNDPWTHRLQSTIGEGQPITHP